MRWALTVWRTFFNASCRFTLYLKCFSSVIHLRICGHAVAGAGGLPAHDEAEGVGAGTRPRHTARIK